MKKRPRTLALLILAAASAALFPPRISGAEPPPTFSRKVLQDQNLTAPGKHAVVAMIDVAVGGVAGRHTHPGEELGYVLEGTFLIEIEGKAPQTCKAGESFFIPAGVVHSAKNAGQTPVKVISSYFLEKGQPLATPAPQK